MPLRWVQDITLFKHLPQRRRKINAFLANDNNKCKKNHLQLQKMFHYPLQYRQNGTLNRLLCNKMLRVARLRCCGLGDESAWESSKSHSKLIDVTRQKDVSQKRSPKKVRARHLILCTESSSLSPMLVKLKTIEIPQNLLLHWCTTAPRPVMMASGKW